MRKRKISIILAVVSLIVIGLACGAPAKKTIGGATCSVRIGVCGIQDTYTCSCSDGTSFTEHSSGAVLQRCPEPPPAPVTCTGNDVLINGACQTCADGQTANHDTNQCETPAAIVCTDNDVLVDGACQTCADGQTANHDTNQCEALVCSDNTILQDGACVACPTGLIANEEATSCTCPGNQLLSSDGQSCGCPVEQILQADQCMTCPMGMIPNADKTDCEPLLSFCNGNYILKDNQCVACPAGEKANHQTNVCFIEQGGGEPAATEPPVEVPQ